MFGGDGIMKRIGKVGRRERTEEGERKGERGQMKGDEDEEEG